MEKILSMIGLAHKAGRVEIGDGDEGPPEDGEDGPDPGGDGDAL